MKKFPHKCCRCGMCCISITCPIGQRHFNISKDTLCPGLSFDSDGISTCSLVKKNLVPIGDGCCIKARAYKNKIKYDFAALPYDLKRRVVRQLRQML